MKIGTCVHIQRSKAVDELLIIPQAYVVSSCVGGWVSPSPKQAAKHIFNTHMHDEHIGKSASLVKLSNQEYSNELHSLVYSTPQSSHLVLGRYNELRSLHCHTSQGSGVEALLQPIWTKHASHRVTKKSESETEK